MLKKILALGTLAMVVMSSIGFLGSDNVAYGADNAVILSVDEKTALIGEEVKNLTSAPFIDSNNRTLVPVRFVSESLGCQVNWDNLKREAEIKTGNKTAYLKIGSKELIVNNEKIEMDTEPVIRNDSVYIPIRFLAENILDKKVSWKDGLIGISDKENMFSDSKIINDYKLKLSGLEAVGSKERFLELLKESENYNGYSYEEEMLPMNGAEAGMKEDALMQEATAEDSSSSRGSDHSETNVQVEGVDESDIIKTDGEYIYYVENGQLYIVNAKNPSDLVFQKVIKYDDNSNINPFEMYLDKNTLTILANQYDYTEVAYEEGYIMPPIYYSSSVKVIVYDITDKSNITEKRNFEIEGNYTSSRKINDTIYLATNNHIYYYDDSEFLLPVYRADGKENTLVYDKIYYFPGRETNSLLNVSSINVNDKNKDVVVETFLGYAETVYASSKNLFITFSEYEDETSKTVIYKFALDNGNIDLSAKGSVPGTILNQFSLDEYNDNFRIATTEYKYTEEETQTGNNLYILDKGLNIIGKINNLAPGERIYSSRFMGDKIYMVTFKQVDPLFVIDASVPTNPKVLGELKIPGYSTYLHPYDENHLIGFGYDTETKMSYGSEVTVNKGLKMAVFDVSDFYNPKELFVETIGDEGSYSELLYNHKALMFDKQRGLLAFPATIVKQKTENIDGYAYHGSLYFNGAVVYTLDLSNGFSFKGQISHSDENQDYYGNINRIIYIKDTLFTTSMDMIKSTDLNSMKTLDSLELEMD